MHIQVTTRCNMTCGHCAFASTPVGDDISLEHFKLALAIEDDAQRNWPTLVLGGGEPTLHPHFWDMIDYALSIGRSVTVTTNGSIKETALRLAQMAKEGKLGAILSLDKWHAPIDPEVKEAFNHGYTEFNEQGLSIQPVRDVTDRRRVRSAPEWRLLKQGRWTKEDARVKGRCLWPRYFVTPSGSIRWCGCDSAAVVGHVTRGIYASEVADRTARRLGCKSLTGPT